jgi:hypothetical protein
MEQQALQLILSDLISRWENEVIEFKTSATRIRPPTSASIFRLLPMKPT